MMSKSRPSAWGGRRLVAAILMLAGLAVPLSGGPASAQSGLVAAWGFDEGSGTTASDRSGNGNAGTVVGAAWTTQGRFGSGLVFNGTTSRVRGPDVTLGPAFTLMAWVLNPTRTTYETMITVGGSRDFYLGSGLPTFYTGSADLAFGTAIADGVWHHLAIVSDGTALRAYLDGGPWGTARAAALGAVTGPLQVGAWIFGASNTDYFAGTLDEVRVYNRALAPGEIQTVMNAPVNAPPADTTPPGRSGGQPTGTLPAGTTQTTLALTTDEAATCRYSAGAGVPYDSMTQTFATTGGTAHSTPVSGLSNGGTYAFSVRCRDAASNANPDDFTLSFSVASTSVPGLMAAWGFDEGSGTVAGDASGNGNAGSVVGGTWTPQGRFGSALVFNGTTSRVTGPSVTLGSAFTLMAWVLNPSRAAYETIITVGQSRDFHLQSGVPTFYTGSANLAFGSALADGAWHHVAVVSDGTTVRALVNGAAWGPTRTTALGGVTGTLQVGAWIFGTNNVDYFAGTIDEVRVYNRALSAGEVQTVMNTAVGPGPSTVLTLTAPADGARVLGATVTANYAVSGDLSQYDHVHLYLDRDPVRMDLDRDGVYQFTNVPAGSHTLRAVPARADHAEFGTASTVSFTTAPDPADPTPPMVALVWPPDGATVSGVVTLRAEASDNVAVAGVQFFIDGVALGSADTAAPWTAPWNTASATAGQHTITVLARDTAANETMSAPVVVTVNNDPSNPVVVGQWGPLLSWPIASVHTTLQRSGEVLIWDEFNGGQAARIWNPNTGALTPVPVASDIFCAGHAALADGRSVVIGGQLDPCCKTGLPDTNLYDSATQTWTRVADMNVRRWYPTATTLPDGRILAISGWSTPAQLADVPEVYDPGTNRWSALTAAARASAMYSFMFVLPDGTVFDAGPGVIDGGGSTMTWTLDVNAQRWTPVGESLITGHSAVMYSPGRVMKSGTLGDPDYPLPSVDGRAVVIDMNQPSPAWRPVASMAFPRAYHHLTLLPDGTVLATGGERSTSGSDTTLAVYEAELWSPATETWTTLARMQRPRLYHSTAILLPDARVLVSGGELSGYLETNAEIYSPPYLFRGPRPTITAVPATLAYGRDFFVETPDASTTTSVALLRLGSTTHGFDQNQRYLSLDFTQGGAGVNVQAPANGRLAPPGYYMLFIVNGNGVPSVARFVQFPGP